jgi:hypothetical protein
MQNATPAFVDPAAIDITLPDGTKIAGTAPLVFVGANGVGKTRLGTTLVRKFGYDRISAMRQVAVNSSIQLQTL